MSDSLQQTIDAAWEERNSIGPDTKGEVRQAVDKAHRRARQRRGADRREDRTASGSSISG